MISLQTVDLEGKIAKEFRVLKRKQRYFRGVFRTLSNIFLKKCKIPLFFRNTIASN